MDLIYWLLAAALALMVVAPFFNASMERRERRRERRAEWEAKQRNFEWERRRSRMRHLGHLGQLIRELEQIGATEAAEKVRERRRQLVLELAPTED